MERFSMEQTFDASPETIRALVTDVGPFIRACGFDTVTVEGSRVHIENSVGLASIELELELVEKQGAVLAYEQRDGIFKEMTTRYKLRGKRGTTTVSVVTDFALNVALVGMILDATVIKRQRQREITAQFEYLEENVSKESTESSPG